MPTNSPLQANRVRRHQVIAIVCLLVLACGLAISPDRAWANLLVGSFYLITLALGGALFIALANVAGGGWHVAFRRVPEAMASILPLAAVAMLVVLGIGMSRYGWHPHGGGDAGTFWFKELWLTPSFWAGRAIGIVLLWSLLATWLVGRSRRQDTLTGKALTAGTIRLSALFLVVYALTITLASVDWIMALEPLWFSTMWGVYHFAGMIQASLAVVVILGLVLRSNGGPLQGIFSDEHLHDLGKLLLGFSCFWMYIWFSQYMLIWYANIPEETTYFILRTHGAWGPVTVISIVLNWIVPFFVLLPRPAKRSESVMMKVAIVVLIGRWVDLYVMIFPPVVKGGPVFGVWEVAAIGCLLSAASVLLLRSFAATKAVPENDPFMSESLHYHA